MINRFIGKHGLIDFFDKSRTGSILTLCDYLIVCYALFTLHELNWGPCIYRYFDFYSKSNDEYEHSFSDSN